MTVIEKWKRPECILASGETVEKLYQHLGFAGHQSRSGGTGDAANAGDGVVGVASDITRAEKITRARPL